MSSSPGFLDFHEMGMSEPIDLSPEPIYGTVCLDDDSGLKLSKMLLFNSNSNDEDSHNHNRSAMIVRRNVNNNDYVDIEEEELIIHNRLYAQRQSQQYEEICVWREPKVYRMYLMVCDILVEMDYTDCSEYHGQMRKFVQKHMPVLSTKFDSKSRTVMLECGTSGERLLDFQYVITMLRAKQDQQLYEISNVLSKFSQIAQATLAGFSRNPEYKSMRVNAVNFFLEVQLKEILKEHEGGYYEFQVFDFANDPFNAYIRAQGYSEKYIELLGSNVEEIQSLFLRQHRLDFGAGEARKNACLEILKNFMEFQGKPCKKTTVIRTLDRQTITCEYMQLSHIELFEGQIVCPCNLLVYYPRKEDIERVKKVRRQQSIDFLQNKRDGTYLNQAKKFIDKYYQANKD